VYLSIHTHHQHIVLRLLVGCGRDAEVVIGELTRKHLQIEIPSNFRAISSASRIQR